MIEKRESCLYCGKKMESKTAKKKFCSDKCKVYWNREKRNLNIVSTKVNKNGKEANFVLESKINYQKPSKDAYDSGRVSMLVHDEAGQCQAPKQEQKPERLKGETGLDYSIRLTEWREKNK